MPLLTIEQLTASYPGRVAIRSLTLSAQPGEVIGLIGPNGSGKTSLLRAISGAIRPTAGRMFLGDLDLIQATAAARARLVASVPQGGRLPEGFTVGEVVLMGRTPHLAPLSGEQPHDYSIAEQAMRASAVSDLTIRRIGELSGGEQQRVLIARALAQEPHVLLLDEATAHLDLHHQTAIMRLIRSLARQGLIVIAALHDLNLAAIYADRLALLHQGELLAFDRPAAVLTPGLLRAAYAVEAVITSHPLYGTPLVALVDAALPD
ncbi:MAG TPA: ABC transporter ATP-binding protein [Roseiflexaceae bacterium]|nr:ABC transporter ATP-binding protein [Roseiflexaceae bacterium]